MTKNNNRKMISIFTWMGLFGGILVALSIAGHRYYSSKASNEREAESTAQRAEIKSKIIDTNNNLSEQISKNDSQIISKLDEVGGKVNKIYENDDSNIKNITFPENGNFGKNILFEKLINIENGTYSMTAILPKNKIIKVKISDRKSTRLNSSH